MPDTLLLVLGISVLLALITAAIIAADQVVNLQKQANRRLDPQGYHWQLFTLTELPQDQAARLAKLEALGQRKGLLQGLAVDGHLAALVGLWLMVRWAFYPKAKKQALRKLAGTEPLAPALVRDLAHALR